MRVASKRDLASKGKQLDGKVYDAKSVMLDMGYRADVIGMVCGKMKEGDGELVELFDNYFKVYHQLKLIIKDRERESVVKRKRV